MSSAEAMSTALEAIINGKEDTDDSIYVLKRDPYITGPTKSRHFKLGCSFEDENYTLPVSKISLVLPRFSPLTEDIIQFQKSDHPHRRLSDYKGWRRPKTV